MGLLYGGGTIQDRIISGTHIQCRIWLQPIAWHCLFWPFHGIPLNWYCIVILAPPTTRSSNSGAGLGNDARVLALFDISFPCNFLDFLVLDDGDGALCSCKLLLVNPALSLSAPSKFLLVNPNPALIQLSLCSNFLLVNICSLCISSRIIVR